VAGRNGGIRLWDVPQGGGEPQPRDLIQLGVKVTSLAFDRDAEHLAVGGVDGATRIVDIADGEEVRSLPGHTGEVRSVAFSPDGELLATGGVDQTILIWETEDGYDEPPGRILGLAEWIRALAFSPDGETLAAVGTQGTVRLLLPRSETVADLACARVRRNLTQAEWDQFVSDKPLRVAWAFWNDAGDYQQTCPEYGAPP
jgi:WD40 repeat protein